MTWFVNSAAHLWGYRNYETRDDSRNNVLGRNFLQRRRLAQQSPRRFRRSARHGHKPWEIDLSWLTIRAMMALGLARDVVLPSPVLAAKFAAGPELVPGDEPSLIHDSGHEGEVLIAPEAVPTPAPAPAATVRR